MKVREMAGDTGQIEPAKQGLFGCVGVDVSKEGNCPGSHRCLFVGSRATSLSLILSLRNTRSSSITLRASRVLVAIYNRHIGQ